jgi:hypothetical protein
VPHGIAGSTSLSQRRATAIAAAVVGPPTLALEAMITSNRSSRTRAPAASTNSRWAARITAANTNSTGPTFSTVATLALAPITAKKICIRNVPMTSAPASFAHSRGAPVASVTVSAVRISTPLPFQPHKAARP